MENLDLIPELVKTIKEISPLVWEAAVRKNQALVYTGIFWAVFLMLMAFILFKFFNYAFDKAKEPVESIIDDNSGWVAAWIICLIGTFVCAVMAFGVLTDVWQRFYAPEYQTILILMELVK